MPGPAGYSDNVFLNCPFDPDYERVFRALVFAVSDCGFAPRCALELDDGSVVRIEKILKIIGECRYGIHDLSRTEIDPATGLPRFNMPLELGVFLGAKRFGDAQQQAKSALILDSEKWRYQAFISDIAEQDPRAHGNDPDEAIAVVRNWLHATSRRTTIPGDQNVIDRYSAFAKELPEMCKAAGIRYAKLGYGDLTKFVEAWLELNAPPRRA